jgi:hypothetical protein
MAVKATSCARLAGGKYLTFPQGTLREFQELHNLRSVGYVRLALYLGTNFMILCPVFVL